MKLRTRIILISFTAVITAVLLSDAVIWYICRNTLMKEALQGAYAETYEVFDDFEEIVNPGIQQVNENDIQYFFKTRRDDYTVCVGKNVDGLITEYYNHTVFSAEVLDRYRREAKEFQNDISYFQMSWDWNSLLCFTGSVGGVTLYHLVDISSVTEKLMLLALGMSAVLLFVIAASGIFLTKALKYAFGPLQKLSETTIQIAEGNYDKRAEVISKDEIGALAAQFNQMAETIESHIDKLEEAERKKNLFMGNLTHELKTPMTAISGYAETMRRVNLSEEEEAEALDYIYKECHRLERLSRKMMQLLELDYSEEIVKTKFPVQKLFDAVIKGCTALAEAKGVTIVIKDTEEVLCADFDLMCDALINLTDNGVKASKPGGNVQLCTEKNGGDDAFVIVVEDFGCGMTPEEAEQIFEPFYMADKSRSRKNGGAGLGLALTALILRNHRMTLTVESEVGCGTRMMLHVPVSGAKMPQM